MGVHSRAPRIFWSGLIGALQNNHHVLQGQWLSLRPLGVGSVAAGLNWRKWKANLFVVHTKLSCLRGPWVVHPGRETDRVFKRRVFRRLQSKLNKKGVKPIYAYKKFRELHKQYPGSKFILNIRDVDDWIASRIRFRNGYHACDHGWKVHETQEDLSMCWKSHWNSYILNVKEFFITSGRSTRIQHRWRWSG